MNFAHMYRLGKMGGCVSLPGILKSAIDNAWAFLVAESSVLLVICACHDRDPFDVRPASLAQEYYTCQEELGLVVFPATNILLTTSSDRRSRPRSEGRPKRLELQSNPNLACQGDYEGARVREYRVMLQPAWIPRTGVVVDGTPRASTAGLELIGACPLLCPFSFGDSC